MYYSAHTHLALARAREAELVRAAERQRLARLVPRPERPGIVVRLVRQVRRRRPEPAIRPAC
jgi:hypothetical protein